MSTGRFTRPFPSPAAPRRSRSSAFYVDGGAFPPPFSFPGLLQLPADFLDFFSSWPCLATGASSLYFVATKRLSLYAVA